MMAASFKIINRNYIYSRRSNDHRHKRFLYVSVIRQNVSPYHALRRLQTAVIQTRPWAITKFFVGHVCNWQYILCSHDFFFAVLFFFLFLFPSSWRFFQRSSHNSFCVTAQWLLPKRKNKIWWAASLVLDTVTSEFDRKPASVMLNNVFCGEEWGRDTVV
jgi:hypothetical protein